MDNNGIRKQKFSQSNNTIIYARFTDKEKDILYSLFNKYNDIIDIKQRKNYMGKKKNFKIRECWQRIVNLYNSHPNITMHRNIKQIQKFWLNSRLRKQFPPPNKICENLSTIKNEPETIVPFDDDVEDDAENEDEEEVQQHQVENQSLYDNNNIEICDQKQQQQQLISSNNIGVGDDVNQRIINNTENNLIENCIEQISPDKLSLNDLLHFKNDPLAATIANIKTPSSTSIHNNNNNNIVQISTTATNFSEISSNFDTKMEQYTQTTPTIYENINRIQFNNNQQCSSSSSSSLLQSQQQQHNYNCDKTIDNITDIDEQTTTTKFKEKLNYYKIKDAEIKYEESKIRNELLKIDLEKSKEELKYIKELNRLRIEEMKIKLKILNQQNKK